MHTKLARYVGMMILLSGVATLLSGCPSPDKIVVITDQGLDKAVRAQLGNPFGFLTKTILLDLTTLDAKQRGIKSLKGLENAKKLEWLDLDTNNITDLTPIKDLQNLRVLNLDDNQLFDISPLAGLFNLDELSLYKNQIGDIGPLVTNTVNGGLGPGDVVVLDEATLNEHSLTVDVPALVAAGVNVVLATAAK